jgi:hypothetical protein
MAQFKRNEIASDAKWPRVVDWDLGGNRDCRRHEDCTRLAGDGRAKIARGLFGMIVLLGVLIPAGCDFPKIPIRHVRWGKMYVTKEGSRPRPGSNDAFSGVDWIAGHGTPILEIRMPDGKLLGTDRVRRDTLMPHVRSGRAIAEANGDVTVNYSYGSVWFMFGVEGVPERIKLDSYGAHDGSAAASPAFRQAGSQTLLTLPVSEKELKDMFGAPTEDIVGGIATL